MTHGIGILARMNEDRVHFSRAEELLDKGDVEEGGVRVDELKQESLGDKMVFIGGIRAMIFLW